MDGDDQRAGNKREKTRTKEEHKKHLKTRGSRTFGEGEEEKKTPRTVSRARKNQAAQVRKGKKKRRGGKNIWNVYRSGRRLPLGDEVNWPLAVRTGEVLQYSERGDEQYSHTD